MTRYFAPAQVTVYINNHWIEDACMLEYTIQDEQKPIYAYNDTTYRSVARGRTIVQGRLALNFRRQGYLYSVLNETVDAKWPSEAYKYPHTLKRLNTGTWFDSLATMGLEEVKDALTLALSTMDKKTTEYQTFKKELTKLFWREGALEATTRSLFSRDYNQGIEETEATARPGKHDGACNIALHFGSDERYGDARFTKELIGVKFIGESSVTSIDVPNDGMPIRETYTFIAKDLLPWNSPIL